MFLKRIIIALSITVYTAQLYAAAPNPGEGPVVEEDYSLPLFHPHLSPLDKSKLTSEQRAFFNSWDPQYAPGTDFRTISDFRWVVNPANKIMAISAHRNYLLHAFRYACYGSSPLHTLQQIHHAGREISILLNQLYTRESIQTSRPMRMWDGEVLRMASLLARNDFVEYLLSDSNVDPDDPLFETSLIAEVANLAIVVNPRVRSFERLARVFWLLLKHQPDFERPFKAGSQIPTWKFLLRKIDENQDTDLHAKRQEVLLHLLKAHIHSIYSVNQLQQLNDDVPTGLVPDLVQTVFDSLPTLPKEFVDEIMARHGAYDEAVRTAEQIISGRVEHNSAGDEKSSERKGT